MSFLNGLHPKSNFLALKSGDPAAAPDVTKVPVRANAIRVFLSDFEGVSPD